MNGWRDDLLVTAAIVLGMAAAAFFMVAAYVGWVTL
jgi:multisubunit Na+/H+ antiporter MnhC subunit